MVTTRSPGSRTSSDNWPLTVGWILCFRTLGDIFDVRAFIIIHIVFCCILGLIWIIIFTLTLAAFFKGFILNSEAEDVLKDSIFSFRYRHHTTETGMGDLTTTERVSRADDMELQSLH